MWRFRAHTRDVFSLFMKFGVPQKGGGPDPQDPPPLDPPLSDDVTVILDFLKPEQVIIVFLLCQRYLLKDLWEVLVTI